MSIDYAAGLSHCDDLGVCGLDEIVDEPESVREKVKLLAQWMRHANGSCVLHVGAGLSTAAGIRDFRGKHGVWTQLLEGTNSSGIQMKKEDQQQPCETKIKPFDETVPTFSHMTIRELCRIGMIGHIVSQNVDGLFLKSNLNRSLISELHGNFYLDECTMCRYRFIRGTASPTMRLQKSTVKCPRNNETTHCRGHLRDTILDWESPIPYNELRVATRESKRSDLHICIGTSLQLRPSKDLVCRPSKTKKLIMINLQPTKFDQQANLVMHYYADEVMKELAQELDVQVPNYDPKEDPTKNPLLIGTPWKR